MSFGFGFALPAYPLRGGTGNNPFNQLGPTLDLSFTGVVTDLTDPNGYTLNTDFIIPQYQIAAQYVVWETGVGLVDKTFSQIITFTRASIGTYFDSAGVLQTATSGTPRFDYNPVTLAPLGFLIEEARTNSVLQSESTTGWGLGALTITTNATTAPTGVSNGNLLVEDTTTAAHSTSPAAISFTSGTAYTLTLFAKEDATSAKRFLQLTFGSAAFGSFPYANFDLGTGTITAQGGGVNRSASIQAVGNGWYRCRLTADAEATTSGTLFFLIQNSGTAARFATYTGNGTAGFFIWGAQLEAGAFPTSYIPTTTTALTRSADVASVNTLSPWFNATAGTVYSEFVINSTAPTSGFPTATSFNNGGVGNRINPAYLNDSINALDYFVSDGGVSQVGLSSTTYTAGSVAKMAAAYATNDFALSTNGGVVLTDTSGTVPSVTAFNLGNQLGGNYINGYLRRITYYPRRLTNDELRTISLPTGATITTQDYSLDTNFVGNTVAIGS